MKFKLITLCLLIIQSSCYIAEENKIDVVDTQEDLAQYLNFENNWFFAGSTALAGISSYLASRLVTVTLLKLSENSIKNCSHHLIRVG